ncbi:hypothetical protein HOLleu_33162 [Holothuria leucospilota]|uniref:Uncharacterized protein n=1 Tax=Holothuria leucospilota TaxID=206669 RepID=A0A9Q0YN80_HOLLE|nr:hypothetical protein HOLleu_33162 [Holothuria leucospilota]
MIDTLPKNNGSNLEVAEVLGDDKGGRLQSVSNLPPVTFKGFFHSSSCIDVIADMVPLPFYKAHPKCFQLDIVVLKQGYPFILFNFVFPLCTFAVS